MVLRSPWSAPLVQTNSLAAQEDQMATTAVGLFPEPEPIPDVVEAELDPWEEDYVVGYESAYLDMVRVVGLGVEHWIECPGCPGCDILGMLVNQVRKEASESNYRVVRETMYREGDYGGLGFGYINTGDEYAMSVASADLGDAAV